MNNFILLHRRIQYKGKDGTDIEPTWVNVENINTIAATTDGDGSRVVMRDGFLLVEEEVNAVLNKIRWENNDAVRDSHNKGAAYGR